MTRRAACIGLNLAAMGLDLVISRGTVPRLMAGSVAGHDEVGIVPKSQSFGRSA
jgi:hypothetical protein